MDFFDSKDNLWVGNSDEGFHIISKNGTEITPIDSISQYNLLLKGNNLINAMMLDAKGKTWLGTYNGLYYFDEANKRFVNTDTAFEGLRPPDFAINSLFQDSKENIWAARWGSITQSSPHGKLKLNILASDGLFDRENKGIAEDKNGNFWFGNFDGLHNYNMETKKLVGFTVNEGLINNNTLNRVYSLDGDQIVVGQKNGLNIIHIDRINSHNDHDEVEISSFKIRDRQYDQDFSQPIVLARNESSFSVEFVALNYSKLQNNYYGYFLEGVDEDWRHSEQYRLASYTNLGPGKYTLHLKTRDAFENWSANAKQFEIIVLPAFYETWWFRISIFLLLIGILYALYKYRINQLLRLQQVRNRISADLHDEIGSSLSGISIMGVIARNNLQAQHPSTPFIQKILEETNQISTSLDDIVWSINPQNDELSNLVARMTRFASEMLEAKDIKYTINIPEKLDNIKLTMEQRRDFYLIFKEALNNLVKYAKCSHATFDIFIKGNKVFLNITDNGNGFDPDLPTERNGIKNMKKRAVNLGGDIKIISSLYKGTKISLEFPL